MKRKIFLMSAILLGATAGSAFAGSWSSGGGSAVVCFRDAAIAKKVQSDGGLVTNEELSAIESIEMLDLFEWKRPRGMDGSPNLPLALPQPGEKYPAFVKRIADRAYNTIGSNSSGFEGGIGNYLATYQSLFTHIIARNIEWTGTSLVHLGDEGTPMRFGGNCTLVPLAVQEGAGYDLRLFIDDRLFLHPKHSEQSRAALFIHEFLYAMGRKNGQTDSSRTRRAVGWMMQNAPDTRIMDVDQELETIGFVDTDPVKEKVHSYVDMHLFSMLAYFLKPYSEDLIKVWADDSFRASAGSRTEGAIVADVMALMRENHIPNREERRFMANKAMVYLDLLPASERREALRAELLSLIAFRAKITVESIRNRIKKNAVQEQLQRLGYIPSEQVATWMKFLNGPIMQKISGFASFVGTEEQMELARKQAGRLEGRIVSFEDVVRADAPKEFSYWLEDLLAVESTETDNYELGLNPYELLVPVL